MKKLFSAFLIALAFFACGPLPQDQEAESAVGITAPDGYAVSCASGYIRSVPHLCLRMFDVGSESDITAPPTGACRTTTFTGIPETAKALLLDVVFLINSNNTVSRKDVLLDFYTDNTCGTLAQIRYASVWEYTAMADTRIASFCCNQVIVDNVPSGGFARIYTVSAYANVGNGSRIQWILMGYYD